MRNFFTDESPRMRITRLYSRCGHNFQFALGRVDQLGMKHKFSYRRATTDADAGRVFVTIKFYKQHSDVGRKQVYRRKIVLFQTELTKVK